MIDMAGIFSVGFQRVGGWWIAVLVASGTGLLMQLGSPAPPGEATAVSDAKPETVGTDGSLLRPVVELKPSDAQRDHPAHGPSGVASNREVEDSKVVIAWPKPTDNKPAWMARAQKQLESQQSMQLLLDREAELDIQSIPLEAALKILLGKNQVPFQVDELSMEEEGIDSNLRIDFQGRGTIRELLMRMLRPYEMDFAVQGDGVFIASRRGVPLVVRVYDLTHIANDNQTVGRIAKLIQHMVCPDKWMIAGGLAQSASMGSVLIISATDSVHAEVELFLGQLAAMGPDHLLGPLLPADQFKANPLHPAGGGMGGMPGMGGGMM